MHDGQKPQTRDEGYSSCSDWGWFDFLCLAWSWISNIVCVAWTWISNVVCVAWEWIKNVVCVAWKYIKLFVCVFLDVLSTILGVLVSILDFLIGLFGGIIAVFVDLITSIPIIGRLIDWILNIVRSIVGLVASIPDALLTLLGIMPEKKLRLAILIQNDERGNSLISDRTVLYRSIQYVINTFREEMNIRVIPVKTFQYNAAFADDPVASDDAMAVASRASPSRIAGRTAASARASSSSGTVACSWSLRASLVPPARRSQRARRSGAGSHP